jgi:hypothetical protein
MSLREITPSKMTEGFQDRSVTSAVCRSVPNGMNGLYKNIDICISPNEANNNANFAQNAFKLQQDIEMLRATVGDSLTMGDAIYGQFGVDDITKQVKARNDELKAKKEKLSDNINKNEAIIERSNRDFTDIKDTLPETQPKKVLHFIEDYTLAFVTIAYLFMIVAAIYVYTLTSEFKGIAILQGIVSSAFLTCFMYIALYYFS